MSAKPTKPTRMERLEGGLLGLLVGDALGVPYEFQPPALIPAPSDIEFTPPDDFPRAHAGVPPGTYSDDGAQALCLLASLLDCGKLDPDDLARRLLAWHEEGYMAVDHHAFDVGIQTAEAFSALRAGTPPLEAGPSDDRANGNGSLMRVLPLALWHKGSDAELVDDAALQSRITHGHPRSQVCCALYCLWARRTFEEAADPWAEAVATLRGLLADRPSWRPELDLAIRPDDDDEPPTGRGYVVDSLRSARWACHASTYEDAVKAAVALGHDTDTTAAIAGGIAGLRDGKFAIPRRWLDALRGQEAVAPLMNALLRYVL